MTNGERMEIMRQSVQKQMSELKYLKMKPRIVVFHPADLLLFRYNPEWAGNPYLTDLHHRDTFYGMWAVAHSSQEREKVEVFGGAE